MAWSRRNFIAALGGTAFTGAVARHARTAAQVEPAGHAASVDSKQESNRHGAVEGHPEARKVGLKVLADGGNAVDAAVATALSAAVIAPYKCGLAGYGGHMTVAVDGGTTIRVIDFNTAAPAVATPDLFPLDDDGTVRGQVNAFGWLASGVPGTLAGLQLAVERFGTRPLAELMQPAIRFAADGFVVDKSLADVIRASAEQLSRDPAAVRMYLPGGNPLPEGSRLKNPRTAELLETLAARGSVDSFYRGDVADVVADAFAAGGGLVDHDDLAAYRAHEIDPLRFAWRGHTVCTAPLTAGGTTVLEALSLLDALGEAADTSTPRGVHAWVEALRVAWDDRLRLFGDPNFVDVPVERLLSAEYAAEYAARIRNAVERRERLPIATESRPQGGTVHLSAGDRDGNLAALTLTHGDRFGAQVMIGELGLMLGGGMSRFDPRPNHPNAPGPRKRPLHNMCPTIVLRDGRAILAVGGAGGRRIPNSVTAVLSQFVGRNTSIENAAAGPRIHTEGNGEVWHEGAVPEGTDEYLNQIGYPTKRSKIALASAVSFDAAEGRIESASR